MKHSVYLLLITMFTVVGCSGSINVGYDGKDIIGTYEGKTKTEGETTSNPYTPGNPGTTNISTSEALPVVIFLENNFTGLHQQLRTGYYDVSLEWEDPNRIIIDNDQIRSIKVHPGFKAICYEDSYRGGQNITVYADTSFDEPWASMISAIEVVKLSE